MRRLPVPHRNFMNRQLIFQRNGSAAAIGLLTSAFLHAACSTGSDGGSGAGGNAAGKNGAEGSGGSVLSIGDSPELPGGQRIECDAVADDCPEGSACSGGGFCVVEGYCGANEDCAEDQTCGAASAKCLNDSQCFVEGDCADGGTCREELELCVIDRSCGSMQVDAGRVPPNLLIVMDRSGSMSKDLDDAPRWDLAKKAVSTVLEAYNESIRFGVATYSACLPGGCSAGQVTVPIGDSQGAAVQEFLTPRVGRGSSDGQQMDGDEILYLCDSKNAETSTGKTLLSFVGEPSLQDPERPNAILLLTDGAENYQCRTSGVDDGPSAAAALLAQDIPVKTYVVGLSDDVTTEEIQLIAEAGGTDVFIHANDQEALTAAFADIAKSVVSCELALGSEPPDLSKLFVFFDESDQTVPRSDPNGWKYDAERQVITFVGDACTRVKSGEVQDIQVVYGCPERIVR